MSPDLPTAVRPDTAYALLHRAATGQVAARSPSTTSGVIRDGRLVWSAGRGLVDHAPPSADTQYRIGSITKGFTAALVLRLRDEGLLTLDDRLEQHLPAASLAQLTPADRTLADRTLADRTLADCTLAALLAHTAGLAAEPAGPWWERSPGLTWPEVAAATTTIGPSSSRFHYSNVGFALLGQVVEHHRGVSWYDALRAEVLEPLGMSRTTYASEPPYAAGFAVHPWADVVLPEPEQDTLAMAPAGQLWSTVGDLARWASFLLGDTGGVLNTETLAEMRAVRVVADGAEWASAYGLGLQIFRVQGRDYVGHGGSIPGYLATLAVDVERGTGAVTLANTTRGQIVVAYELLEILEQHEPSIPPPWQPVESVDAGVAEIVGLWHWGPAPYTLRLRSDGLLELAGVGQRGRGSRFNSSDAGAWVGLDDYFVGETLRAVRGDDGSVSHLDVGTFVFTREPYDRAAPVPGGLDPSGWGPGFS